ncbi:GAF domain-containing protein [Opitutus sp. ER46]|uniref:GAF domain-containing protein n=1 Tax=Opitutus sp. ER46 TaxID=2161864 RepID=UPI000D301E48|nr:GAF domain-containing protein [Opitutus sp. ER46]PTX97706.1 histidine kinase [Opitutus sp. ER46]
MDHNRPPTPTSSPTGAPPPPASADPRVLPALYQIASLAARTDDPEFALRELLDLFVTLFRADAGSIALISPDTGRLETEVQVGGAAPRDLPGLKLGHGVTGWCVLNRRPLLVRNVATEPRYIAVRAATCCEMAAPMLDEDGVVGVVDLESNQVDGFAPGDLTALVQLAGEAARVLQRLWQVRHLQGKARQLESLISAGQSLVTKLEQQELFDTLAREARDMLCGCACALHLYDATADTVRLAAWSGPRALTLSTTPLPLDSCMVAAAIHTRRAVTFADVQTPDFRELADLPPDATLTSALITPMLFEGEVLGVIVVFTDRIRRFDNDDKRLSAALASLGAVALQNARLYARVFESEDVLRKNERLTTLGLLAAEIAHEIRNPLTVLKLLHGGLGLDFAPGDPRHTDMRVISEKLDQLEAIVGRVLNFAQAPSSLHARVSLTDIIGDTLVLVRLKLAQSKVALRFEPPARPLFVDAHKGQIQQVLLNLLLNATHAMPEGGSITIRVGPEERAGTKLARIDIVDTGRGVPEAIRDRIFDSFLSGRPDGTGLGLGIAKRILASHHGDIALHDTGPAGTTMRITLPLAK